MADRRFAYIYSRCAHTCPPFRVTALLPAGGTSDEFSPRKPAHHAALMTNGSCVSRHLMCLAVSLTLLALAADGLDGTLYPSSLQQPS
jgi:hypothetical protein